MLQFFTIGILLSHLITEFLNYYRFVYQNHWIWHQFKGSMEKIKWPQTTAVKNIQK